jgi:TldD protein
LDGRVRQARVLYRDLNQVVCIANSEGVLREGERSGMVFSVQVVSADGDTVQTGYEAVGGTMGFELFEFEVFLGVV